MVDNEPVLSPDTKSKSKFGISYGGLTVCVWNSVVSQGVWGSVVSWGCIRYFWVLKFRLVGGNVEMRKGMGEWERNRSGWKAAFLVRKRREAFFKVEGGASQETKWQSGQFQFQCQFRTNPGEVCDCLQAITHTSPGIVRPRYVCKLTDAEDCTTLLLGSENVDAKNSRVIKRLFQCESQ